MSAMPECVYTWKCIAFALQLPNKRPPSISTVQRWAERNVDPLPLSKFNGEVWAYRSALEAWLARQHRPFLVDEENRKLREENSHLRACIGRGDAR